ncbi:MAG: RNA methyltransferase [Alphaproteobacteria bacterium]
MNDLAKDASVITQPAVTLPAIILVEPQMGENIGACARAMMNCALTDLRIVAPRDGWPNPAALAMSANAESIVEQATIYDTLDEALADLNFVLATTARKRDMVKPVWTPSSAANEIQARVCHTQKTGIMFGRERSGLENEQVARANGIINVPLNPENTSLNLGQAVLLVGYELFQVFDHMSGPATTDVGEPPATKQELDNFCNRLFANLRETRFLELPEKRPRMERNIRNIFERADLTTQEINTLHGIVKALGSN